MLSRAERLSATEFSRVFDNGRVLRHPLLQLRVLRRTEESKHHSARSAFVAPKKLGKAVQRNRIRRQVRERYRFLKAKKAPRAGVWLLLENCDLVWIIGSAAQAASREELDGALGDLMQRAARFIEKSGLETKLET